MEASGQRSLMEARTRHGVWKPVMGLSKEHSQRSGQESQQHFGLIPDTYCVPQKDHCARCVCTSL